jgi:hypothetical protein
MDIREFWEITPSELFLKVKAYQNKLKRNEQLNIYNAYLSAYWQRVKKMPSLKEVFESKDEKKQSSAEELFEKVKQLNAKLGGVVIGD